LRRVPRPTIFSRGHKAPARNVRTCPPAFRAGATIFKAGVSAAGEAEEGEDVYEGE
jgi:hypothetical protein